jgi:two-component system response regulator HydG
VSSSTNASNTKIRILVVDDEPDILFTLKVTLEGQRHYVKTFDNPIEALSHLTSSQVTPYDLVITDYRMPGSGISGIDLATRIRQHTERKTKVFLMSGSFNKSSLPEEFEQVLKSGVVDEFIQKPIPSDKLISIVQKI